MLSQNTFFKKVPYKFHGRPTAHFPTPKKGFLMTILWNWTELRGSTVKAFYLQNAGHGTVGVIGPMGEAAGSLYLPFFDFS